jgi:hypothetical protein
MRPDQGIDVSATLTVIYWRDIPAQVNAAADGQATARVQLHERFQQAIDLAAMEAGLAGADAYLEQWRHETRPCGRELHAEAAAEADRLEAEHGPDVLARLVRSGGLRQ